MEAEIFQMSCLPRVIAHSREREKLHFYSSDLRGFRGFAGKLRAGAILMGRAMKRYFFDLDGQRGFVYDHEGRDCETPDAAYQLAEMIALDLEVEGEWAGWAVAVCSPDGKRVFSIPVRSEE
jgi:hypothetical protein